MSKRGKKRNGFGSREKGDRSLKDLKSRYEHTGEVSPYDSARNLIKENIPKPLEGLVDILARAVARLTRKGELGLVCEMIGMLVVYETRSMGCEIEDLRHKTVRSVGKRGTVRVQKDFSSNENIFRIEEYNITCSRRELENILSGKYGLNVKFDPSI